MKKRDLVIPNVTIYEFEREDVNLTYDISVYIPGDTVQKPKKGWPVYYVLDGNATFVAAVEMMRIEGKNSNKTNIAPGVVVGIAEKSDESFPENRSYDFTTKAKPELMETWFKNRNIDVFKSGGADQFVTFMLEHVQPFVQTLTHINKTRETLMGHSLAALFVLYLFQQNPMAFQRYVIASPSLWWNDGELFSDMPDGLYPAEVLVITGSDEPFRMKDDAQKLAPLLEKHVKKVTYTEFVDENHGTVLTKALRTTIKNI